MSDGVEEVPGAGRSPDGGRRGWDVAGVIASTEESVGLGLGGFGGVFGRVKSESF